MSRTSLQVLDEVHAVGPGGWGFPGRDTLYAAIMSGFTEGVAKLEATAEALFEETDPRTASLCLSDWERVLGPDPCGRDLASMSVTERRDLAHQRLTARGGASIAYFIALAARRGVAITITENRCSVTDELECDGELIEPPEQFVWTVTLPLAGDLLFEVDDGAAGDLLYDITLSDIECDLRRLKPAHTEIAFRYI